MTDDDVFERRPVRGWRRVTRLMKERRPPAEVAPALEEALVRTLRCTGGVPSLPHQANSLFGHASSTGLPPAVAATQAPPATGGNDGAVARYARAYRLAPREPLPRSVEQIERRLANKTLVWMAEYYCFDRFLPDLVGTTFTSYDELARYVDDCLKAARLGDISRQLWRRPDAVGLRRSPVRRQSTSELLSTPVQSGERA